MEFSRFKFSVVLNILILTQSVNIVKRFFLFHQVFYKTDGKFSALLFFDSLIIISNRIRFVKNIFKLFSNFFFPTDPLPRGYKRKARLLSSDSLTILPLFGLSVKCFQETFLKNFIPYSNFLSLPVLSLFLHNRLGGHLTAACDGCICVCI